MTKTEITQEMIERYYNLNRIKKEVEAEMNQLKKTFHTYFDNEVGENEKGEWTTGTYKLQRQVRKTEKFNDNETVERLEELNMNDLIQVVKKPDGDKIDAAINLGLLKAEDLEGCRVVSYSRAISVREV
ncbi:hypothetical protein [Oceanobacillus salinisoli]|uniref:hypothetical protein n=1 Tax=Oceanobacillus salinisoli TaxID=2678611 RepID=UPI0012E17370|nr:hypothetical protein [Oceanobacillus salinisoli]